MYSRLLNVNISEQRHSVHYTTPRCVVCAPLLNFKEIMGELASMMGHFAAALLQISHPQVAVVLHIVVGLLETWRSGGLHDHVVTRS